MLESRKPECVVTSPDLGWELLMGPRLLVAGSAPSSASLSHCGPPPAGVSMAQALPCVQLSGPPVDPASPLPAGRVSENSSMGWADCLST